MTMIKEQENPNSAGNNSNSNNMSDYLLLFHVASAGLNGDLLGSDEEDIVKLAYLIYDVKRNSVISRHNYLVRPSNQRSLPSPSSRNDSDVNANPSKNSNSNSPSPNLLSDSCRLDCGVTDEEVRSAQLDLRSAIDQFDKEVVQSVIHNNQDSTDFSSRLTLVTDGQLHVRQALIPEAQRRGLTLPSYYYSFHDLRKEAAAKVGTPTTNVQDMLNQLGLEALKEETTADAPTLPEMLNGNDEASATECADGAKVAEDDDAKKITPSSSPTRTVFPPEQEVEGMARIVNKLICDGVRFHSPDVVQTRLEQGIRSRSDAVDQDCCVRARGLPWQASDQDIARFFVGLNVARGGVALCLSAQGRRNGEALVLFECPAHREMALRRHKHHIGQRYIEVYKATGEDFINIAGGNNKEAQQFLSRGGQVIIRMRGLPYDCTAKQVTEFFDGGKKVKGEEETEGDDDKNVDQSDKKANGEDKKEEDPNNKNQDEKDPSEKLPCSVLDGESGVLFVRKPDGRATGDAFVLFRDESDAEKALAKHKEVIGSRYIELFRSTTAEVQQVLNRTMENHHNHGHHRHLGGGGGQQHNSVNNQHAAAAAAMAAAAAAAAAANQLPLIPHLPPAAAAVMPQQIITAGTRKDCIRLRGLPYEAQVEHILEFLGDHAKSIVYQGVHMVYNAQGQPSGEAFIQMSGEPAAFAAAQQRHHRYMVFGKKQRYIEVFQCSGEDMSLVLTGAAAASAAPSVASAADDPKPAAVTPTTSTGGGGLLATPTGPSSSTHHKRLHPPHSLNPRTSPSSSSQISSSSSSSEADTCTSLPTPPLPPYFVRPPPTYPPPTYPAPPPPPMVFWPYPSPSLGYYGSVMAAAAAAAAAGGVFPQQAFPNMPMDNFVLSVPPPLPNQAPQFTTTRYNPGAATVPPPTPLMQSSRIMDTPAAKPAATNGWSNNEDDSVRNKSAAANATAAPVAAATNGFEK